MLARLVASHPLPLCQSVSKSYRKIRPVNVVIHETGKVYGDGEGAAHLAATRPSRYFLHANDYSLLAESQLASMAQGLKYCGGPLQARPTALQKERAK
ncbi:hypothetical protein SCLCIDRAFT_645264 [Scleroderma citrinum Foug A]|uniref:Uncharacterized protein n=1 Tax=Scleroderma citrinum Foug A TaxID=1036808 RepID=A0A0C3E7B7_9AGAM|nr:hypothetical protein SCLCIDRAFT_645264 [Scleroderma citrinum Foug A]